MLKKGALLMDYFSIYKKEIAFVLRSM